MDRLKNMKDCLIAQAQSQMGNLTNVDAKELGEVIDMIKDLEEAIYYCTITKAMNGEEKHHYYMDPKYNSEERVDRRYYDSERNYYQEYPIELRDHREGRSPKSRRMYMKSKEMHRDKDKQIRELEQYLKELSEDIAEMIEDATPEEKTMLKTKLSNLATRIA